MMLTKGQYSDYWDLIQNHLHDVTFTLACKHSSSHNSRLSMNATQRIDYEFYNTIFTEVRGESLTSTKVESVNLDLGSYYVAAHFCLQQKTATPKCNGLTTKPKITSSIPLESHKACCEFPSFSLPET